MLLPPNSKGVQGIISLTALTAFSSLRNRSSMTVLVTGARTSTMLQRLPFLPKADAYVSEGGGRIWWHDHTLPTAACIAEDYEWRAQHASITGPVEQDGVPAARRQGALWDAFRGLQAAGWDCDGKNYATAFRVSAANGKDLSALQAQLEEYASGLTCSGNLGHMDVYPTTSGKDKAAEFLMRRMAAQPAHCRLLCDDDNDLKLAEVVGHVWVVSVTHPNVQKAADMQPEKFTIAKKRGILATDEVLAAVRDDLNTFVLG